jgi:hypothetical protein
MDNANYRPDLKGIHNSLALFIIQRSSAHRIPWRLVGMRRETHAASPVLRWTFEYLRRMHFDFA